MHKIHHCIDIQIEVSPVEFDDISSTTPSESSAAIRERVVKAREIQTERFRNVKGVHCNAQMTSALLRQYAQPDEKGFARLRDAMERLNMSARLRSHLESGSHYCRLGKLCRCQATPHRRSYQLSQSRPRRPTIIQQAGTFHCVPACFICLIVRIYTDNHSG